MAGPLFSVVVPTRDRPNLLAFCLESLAAQTFDDFEVIVSDNPTTRSAREVFERWERPGWRLLTPDRPLLMHDNFELACSEARGEHVAALIDKTVLHPSALGLASEALAPQVDIVTWWSEGYDPVDEARRVGRGRFVAAASAVEPASYDARAELDRRFAFAERRGVDPIHYARGKIVFGTFSRQLLGRIRELTGRVFHPLAPDYTSMVPACVLARDAVDLGRPLLVSYNSVTSNGRQQTFDTAYARRFIESIDPGILDALPVPGLYASAHNVVAYDLASSAARLPQGSAPALDLPNLLRRAREDLDLIAWADAGEQAAQYALLEAAEAEYGVEPAPPPAPPGPAPRSVRFTVGRALHRAPTLERLVYKAARRPLPGRPVFGSPVEAARLADRHYSLMAPS